MAELNFDDFIIRPIDYPDAENFCAFVLKNFNRIASSAPNTVKAVKDVESTKAFIRERIERAEKKELLTFAVFEAKSNKPIANVVIMNIDWTIPKGEFGFYIDGDYEGKGVMTKIVSVLIDHAFGELGFNKLFMRIAEKNISSKRVAEKNGFEREGLLKSDYRNYEGELVDVVYYGLCNPVPRMTGD